MDMRELISDLSAALQNMSANVRASLGIELSRCQLREVCSNPLPVGPERGRELSDRIRKELAATSWKAAGATYENLPLRWLSVQGSPALVPGFGLCLLEYEKRLHAYILVEANCDAELVRKWSTALAAALSGLREGPSKHLWWAVLGPDLTLRGPNRVVLGSASAGGLSIAEGNVVYAERLYQRSNITFHISSDLLWLPLTVEGTSLGYDWPEAAQDAYRQLFESCALISLEAEQRWVVRERPQPRSPTAPELGKLADRPPGSRLRAATTEEIQRARDNPLTIDSAWLSHAIGSLKTKRLFDAASVFYEGVGLQEEHTSFAAVAFVTCIEQLGDYLFQEEDPPACSECGKKQFSSRSRLFEKALGLAASQERAKWLIKLYGRRSATAHQGRLFGHESILGNYEAASVLSAFASEPQRFETSLHFLRKAAKDLLRRVLGGDLVPQHGQ